MRRHRAGSDRDPVAAVDEELKDASARLRHTPERRAEQRELLHRHIDDLLDRRLQLQDDTVIHATCQQLTSL
jgi:hypothetical protein